MSVVTNLLHWAANASGYAHLFGHQHYQKAGGGPPAPPPVPNPNDAANAAQEQTDQLRMRRGLLANIFAGATNTPPVTGKTQLGS